MAPVFLCLAAVAPTLAQSRPADLWSLRRPERPPVPALPAAAVAHNAIDAFVLARLATEGLTASPEADRPTLLRRLAFDLCGLPPTPAEVDAFVGDARPDAYERQVDRLLASPHYGERMASHWLDLAHYTDTNGYDGDPDREMWAWRDWVIDAFQRDMPFDQFTIEQLAGDLLPEATLSQRVATGFLRNHAVAMDDLGEPGEYRHRYVADRVATTATTWLGLTIACAECHDHKFDPISQRDYYGLYAFFDRVPERGLRDGGNAEPLLRLPTAAQGTRLLELQARRDELAQQRRARAEATIGAQQEWVASLATATVPAVAPSVHVPLDGDDQAHGELVGIGKAKFVPAIVGQGLWLDGKDSFVQAGPRAAFRADMPFSLSAWVRLDAASPGGGTVIAKVDEARGYRGYALEIGGGKLRLILAADLRQQLRVEATARHPLAVGEWHHVAATYDGSRQPGGLRLFVDGAPAPLVEPDPKDKAPAPLADDIDNDTQLRVGATDGSAFAGALDEVRLFDRALPPDAVAALVAADLRACAAASAGRRDLEDLLRRQFLDHVDTEGRALAIEHAEAGVQHETLLRQVPQVSVMSEMTTPRPTHVLVRGDFSRPGERVDPAIPGALGSLPAGAPGNRLGLARWLVHPDNPLVGRVAANRLWRQLFGHGLCATLDDFGTRGERPSHPELLDWLAREFVDGGFRHKAFLKLLVMSATYRQRSHVDAAALTRDPDNRLLQRAARWRLDAESVRDNALAIAGLLDPRIGGPSIRPWQPKDLWAEVTPPAEQRRRGLYVQVRRQVPFVAFTVFDAPSREVCVARRDATTTPLQALVLLNEPGHVEAASSLAQLLLGEAGDARQRLSRGWRRCVARMPEPAELDVLLRLLHERQAAYRRDPAAAAALIAGTATDAPVALALPELAAWTAVAAVLLNLDETTTRS